MVKKGAKESSPKKEKIVKPAPSSGSSVERALIENFVSLQHVMADLSLKLNNLANQMSRLLELFETSAKTFMEKDVKLSGSDKEATEKLDKLLEQNKVIARGLALLHEANAQTEESYSPQQQFSSQSPFTQPQMTQQVQPGQQTVQDRYQKSISSK
jgi:hypothetical protein